MEKPTRTSRYEAERAGRQFDATEPENRLVARTLEKAWEVKLRVVRQVEQDHERFQQEQPARLTATQRSQIQMLTADLPALWNASTTTDEDRKVILRQMVDRVVVNVEGNTEWVELRIHWVGGHETYSRVRRPVGGTAQLSHWPNLLNRLEELKDQGLSARQIAGQLHDEGFKPAKGGRLQRKSCGPGCRDMVSLKSARRLPFSCHRMNGRFRSSSTIPAPQQHDLRLDPARRGQGSATRRRWRPLDHPSSPSGTRSSRKHPKNTAVLQPMRTSVPPLHPIEKV